MKINKYAKKIAKDLNLSAADALIMELKSKLYIQAAEAIKNSKMSHEEIALKAGTSRARITRISLIGENNISIEFLMKIIVILENKVPLQFIA